MRNFSDDIFFVFICKVLTVIVLVGLGGNFAAAAEECSEGDHLTQVQCISRQIQLLDKSLNISYQHALNVLPEKDSNDTRKEKEQLRRSQRAWLKFKNENCAFVGGLENGNNLSVTHLAAICEKQMIEERIKFLDQVIRHERY